MCIQNKAKDIDLFLGFGLAWWFSGGLVGMKLRADLECVCLMYKVNQVTVWIDLLPSSSVVRHPFSEQGLKTKTEKNFHVGVVQLVYIKFLFV